MRRERETWLFISDRPRRGGRDRCANGQRRLSRGGRERASRSDRRASLPIHAGRTPRFESERIFDAPKLAADKMALPEQLEEERLRCTLRLEALENRLRGTRPARLLHTKV